MVTLTPQTTIPNRMIAHLPEPCGIAPSGEQFRTDTACDLMRPSTRPSDSRHDLPHIEEHLLSVAQRGRHEKVVECDTHHEERIRKGVSRRFGTGTREECIHQVPVI